MNDFFSTHKKIKYFGIVLALLVLIVVLFLAFFDWNSLRPTLARMISARTGRETSIAGALRVHVWSWNPSAEIDGLTIKNPKWAEHEVMFNSERLIVSVSLGHLLRGQLVLPQVEVMHPVIDLERDAKGRASWEFGGPSGNPTKSTQPAKIPAIRRLIIQEGKIRLSDKIRKLILSGSLSAADQAGKADPDAFKLRCSGSLNAKPFHMQLNGGPLVNLAPDRPYDMEAHVTASDIKLDARMSFPKPFDLGAFRVKFEISGGDLADVYYLTGLALPNTPRYRLAADLRHSGTSFRMDDLKGRLGSSDIEGEMQIETAADRPKLSAKLKSTTLNIVDLAPTLGHPSGTSNTPPPQNSQENSRLSTGPKAQDFGGALQAGTGAAAPSARLLPDADLQVNRVRGMDADVTYNALSVAAPKVPLQHVSFHLTLDNGLLRLDPLAFVLDKGKFAGSVQIDARKDDPESTIDMRVDDIHLSQFKPATAKQPPVAGPLEGRLQIQGSGTSIHKLAASADGALSVAIPHGDISNVLAELTGINVLKGLGLLLSDKDDKTQIRCGVADFKAHDGVLESRTVFIDTTNVLITGRGNINLDTERPNLVLQGDPKKLRLLRLRAPVTLHGTLLHPAIGVQPGKLAAQVVTAAALGTILTPVAAALAFIDPGLAKNKDCASVLAQAQADQNVKQAAAPPP